MPYFEEHVLQPVKVKAFCDNCGGEMLNTGIVKPAYPELYEHKCDGCGALWDSKKSYPHIQYREIEVKHSSDGCKKCVHYKEELGFDDMGTEIWKLCRVNLPATTVNPWRGMEGCRFESTDISKDD